MNFTIARALNIFGMAVVIGCLIIAGAAVYSLQQLRVGGSTYTNMIAGKDLVADVLPPPLYVIEAYLNATLMADEKISLDTAKARFAPLRKDFTDRRAVWAGSNLPSMLVAEVAASSAAADKFWTVLEDKYLPAVARQDKAGVQAHGAELAAAYGEHRKRIDILVVDANKFLQDAEAAAHKAGELWQTVLLSTAGLVLVFVIIGVMVIRRRVVRPLFGMADYMTRLAGGTYNEEVPYAQRSDEIGEMAHAVSVFRSSAIERLAARKLNDEARAASEENRQRVEALEKEADMKRQRVVEALAMGLDHIASGDLAFRLTEPMSPEYEKLRSDFNAAISALAGTLKEISVAPIPSTAARATSPPPPTICRVAPSSRPPRLKKHPPRSAALWTPCARLPTCRRWRARR
jgi:methyl-accepting chemotaxis protein